MDDLISVVSEIEMEKFMLVVVFEVGLIYLIIYDVYNFCDMFLKFKLKNLFILQLRDICKLYDIDVNEVIVKCKLFYIEYIINFCKECICQKKGS